MRKIQLQIFFAAIALMASMNQLYRNRAQFMMIVSQQRTTPATLVAEFNLAPNSSNSVYANGTSDGTNYTTTNGLEGWESIASKVLTVTRSNNIPNSPCDPFRLAAHSNGTGGFKHHSELVRTAQSAPSNLDVLFLGDSIIEQWNGTIYLGRRFRRENREEFNSKFSRARGANLEGLAFGSAGDQTHQLSWHIDNGLLPESFNPKVIWILIGTNNFNTNCSTPETVLSSILEVARRVHEHKPLAKIVIQGILPRGDSMGSFALETTWKLIQKTNRRLASVCQKFPQLHYFEIKPRRFMKWYAPYSTIDTSLFRDGVHPTLDGYKMIGGLVQAEVLKLISNL